MFELWSLRRFAWDRRGSVSIVGALMLPILLGMSALAVEYGGAVLVKVETQRVADLSANAGASAYARRQNNSEMTMAAEGVAILNGLARENVRVTLEPSPVMPGAMAVRVTITTQRTLILARVLDTREFLDVEVDALAVAVAGEPACIQALDPSGSGVTLSGGTSVTADECVIASNARVTAPCGTHITATAVNYGSAAVPSQCNNISTASGGAAPLNNMQTPDPLAGNAAIGLATARIATAAAMTGPAIATGDDIHFGWNQSATRNQATAVGCVATFASSTWTLTCPGRTSVNLGNITIGGGLTLNFGSGGAATTVYNFSGGIHNGGGSVMLFASGIYNIAKGITVPDGSRTEFAAGSFRVGPANDGNAIDMNGGATLVMGSTITTGGTFQIVGNVETDGGTCLVFGAAANHDIRGYISASGAVVLGAGVYTFDGYFHLGSSNGGSASCNGTYGSLMATDVTIILSGRGAPTNGWQCRDQAFCAAAGYSNMVLRAPSTGPFAKFAVIGPQNISVNSGAAFTSGASGSQISGAFYFPNGPISLSGGASASGGSSGCLQIIGSVVTLSGGTTLASECVAPVGGSQTTVRLLE